MSESFSERMRRRWSARRGDRGPDGGPGPGPGAGSGSGAGGAFGADPRDASGPAGGGPGNPFGGAFGRPYPDLPGADDDVPPPPVESENAARARMMHEKATEAYGAGDVALVAQLADLMPEGPDGEPYRTYVRVLAAEGQADDAEAAEIARSYLERLHSGHPEWETARTLFGEVMVQALVMGAVPLAGNLTAAEEALAAPTDYFVHPSGMLLKFAEAEEQHPLLLVLHGDTVKSVRAAQSAVRQEKKGTPAGYADALCTLALAACAAGDITGARRALDDAERVLPGRPRIAATRARIESSPAATLRTD
ncbi:hypothetical protein LO772_21165 [Yinghuangia sp. ASG 101]|uniref:hypothetical protein n=1 Tax=Yinghuangia sp. ASG 101 TaxID=2896848 RepID=UPI001E5770F4|nr:hypothetical protein [Yinghuangia sp. ASG 101]UGQ09446.1 hypothetical protein LO772_21165 [Yinghuangia sp. ASG 101]